jgi:hypothetical protein
VCVCVFGTGAQETIPQADLAGGSLPQISSPQTRRQGQAAGGGRTPLSAAGSSTFKTMLPGSSSSLTRTGSSSPVAGASNGSGAQVLARKTSWLKPESPTPQTSSVTASPVKVTGSASVSTLTPGPTNASWHTARQSGDIDTTGSGSGSAPCPGSSKAPTKICHSYLADESISVETRELLGCQYACMCVHVCVHRDGCVYAHVRVCMCACA